MPEVCVSRSRIVIFRFAGTADTGVPGTAPVGGDTMTVVFSKAGMNFDDRVVQKQFAVLHQHHRRDAGNRLRHRRDPEDRVGLHWRALLDIALPVRGQLHDLALPHDDRHDAGVALRVDVRLHHGGQACQAIRGKTQRLCGGGGFCAWTERREHEAHGQGRCHDEPTDDATGFHGAEDIAVCYYPGHVEPSSVAWCPSACRRGRADRRPRCAPCASP